MKTTGIILAGGKSSRMGTNKALLDLNGRKVIEGIVEKLGDITDEVLLVTNTYADYEFLQVPMIGDHWREMGPLAGVEAGLTASKTEYNLIVACDMPFISVELGRYLLACLDESQAAVPQIDETSHPLFAAYRREVLAEVRKSLEKRELGMWRFLKKVEAKIITKDVLASLGLPNEEQYFFNMNNREHYQRAIHFINNNCGE
ncbi:NTP transferase domain-containing protein [Bacillus benzoevorans]|uniref:Probable molybdenum cofactor guanylyltransferase n=1 Tax=Bacillus benzoevorans TaxID=1456 RepID=A0A7X0HRP4_9BACI|nr:molybdopterin-guanine dinucleotide biosynthesis protein A [Bacillus benzoevorans]